MHTSDSVIQTIVERARFLLNMPEVDKYNNAYVVNHLLTAKWAEIISSLNLDSERPVRLRMAFTTAEDQRQYTLPSIVGNVTRLMQVDDESGAITADWVPSGSLHPDGYGWRLNGNSIEFYYTPTEASEWILEYIPSGDGLMHYGTGTLTTSTSVTLAATPTLGRCDRRENAYVGWIFRIIPTSGGMVQERMISEYNAGSRVATLSSALTLGGDSGLTAGQTYTYEVAPPSYSPLMHAVAAKVAMSFGVPVGLSMTDMTKLDIEYRNAMKATRDILSNAIERVPKTMDRQTVDNPETDWGLR